MVGGFLVAVRAGPGSGRRRGSGARGQKIILSYVFVHNVFLFAELQSKLADVDFYKGKVQYIQ